VGVEVDGVEGLERHRASKFEDEDDDEYEDENETLAIGYRLCA
jgi:hypothetical protein